MPYAVEYSGTLACLSTDSAARIAEVISELSAFNIRSHRLLKILDVYYDLFRRLFPILFDDRSSPSKIDMVTSKWQLVTCSPPIDILSHASTLQQEFAAIDK